MLDLLVGLVVLHRSRSLLASQPIVALVVVVDCVCILVMLEAHTIKHVQTLFSVSARTKFQLYQTFNHTGRNDEFQVEIEFLSFIVEQGLNDSNGFVVLTLSQLVPEFGELG